MPLGEFRRRFGLLASDNHVRPGSPVADERREVEDMLLSVDVDPASYRVGQSQVSYNKKSVTKKGGNKRIAKMFSILLNRLTVGL